MGQPKRTSRSTTNSCRHKQLQVDRTTPEALSKSDTLITWGFDSDGRIAWSSPAWQRFTGISIEQQTQHRWQTFIHPEDETGVEKCATDHGSHQQKMAREFRLLHHDGTFHPVLGYVHHSLDPTNSESGSYAACFEIQGITTNDVKAAHPDQAEKPQAEIANHIFETAKFDHQAIRDLFENDARSLHELAELFDTTCEESLEFLATAFTTPNQPDLFSTAHRLKGAIANMHAPQVAELCEQLEKAIQANNISVAEEISQQVIRSVVQLQEQVKKEFRI